MQKLVTKAMQGDADAFLELMERNSLAMYKVAWGILKNEADVADAIQDTILTCFEKLHTLKNPEYFKTWMTRILIHECTDILRHYHKVELPGEMPAASAAETSYAELEFKEMLNQMDEKYRLVILLYYVQEFSVSEIAELLKMKENTVKTRLSRGRAQIREVYEAADSIQKANGPENAGNCHRKEGVFYGKTSKVW